MDFIKELKEMEVFKITETINPLHMRKFYPMEVQPGIFLSIQASEFVYCKPRETLKDLSKYTHWEVALTNENEFLNVLETFPEFQNRLELEYYRRGPVYNYVPTDLVNDLYLALKN